MKARDIFFLAVLLAALTTACSAGRVTLSQDQLKTIHNITVLPYKASPMKLDISSGKGIPIAETLIVSSTLDDRGKSVAKLNNDAGGAWNPSLITAEECLKVLKKSSKVSVINSSIQELSEIPGADRVRKEDARIFTETNSYWSNDWDNIWKDFRVTNNSLIEYKKNHATINSDWFLEIFDFGLYFTNDVIHLGLVIKLNDSSSNKKVAVGWKGTGWSGYGYDIPEFQAGFKFIDFEQRFRDVSQTACSEVLKEMGLY